MAGFTTRPVIMGTRGVIAAGHYLAAAIGMHVLETGRQRHRRRRRGRLRAQPDQAAVDRHRRRGADPDLPRRRRPRTADRRHQRPGQRARAARRSTGSARRGVDVIPGDGFLPITIPAAFGAWVTALLHYGTLTLKETLGPVVETARGGFAVYPAPAQRAIERHAERFREEWPSTAAIYLEADGSVPADRQRS